MPSPEPEFDCTRIAFPSDTVSIKDLRRLFPHEFDNDEVDYVRFFAPEAPQSAGAIALGDMLHSERRLAQMAFEDRLCTLSKERVDAELKREREQSKKKHIDVLNKTYQAFGICHGTKSVNEEIRSIRLAAAAQANITGRG